MKLFSQVLGGGDPLIIMHGLFGMGDNWMTLARRWADDYEVHVLDMRNHGRSPWSEEHTYQAMALDVVEYLGEKNLSLPMLLGHSMGGKVAMEFATQWPGQLSKLVVADIAPRGYPIHHREILEALMSLDLESYSSRSEADEALALHLSAPSVRQFLLKSLHRTDDKKLAFRFNLEVLNRNIGLVGEAIGADARYDGPTLFIRGGQSGYIRDEDAVLIHEHFPQARLETIEGVGHWLHAEAPEEFFRRVSGFLGE